ncbi:MAG: type IV pilus modification protein PilV [Sulfuritalea sp.]|nr:type IV pilus modification protein PilV [Sulfuritalea sp.]
MHMNIRNATVAQGGFSLLEVIITMGILAVGLLGLAGLQARAINAEADSFSRGQAIMLANEMADRMNANLAEVKTSTSAATGYNQQSGGGVKVAFGTGYSNDCITVTNNTATLQAACCAAKSAIVARDLCEWDLSLKGIGEAVGTSKVGGMNGARACVFNTGTAGIFQIDVAWQGRDIGVVPSDNSCGSTAIASRRSGVSRVIRVADLDGT